jgi:2-isopropylmalate synthase
MFEIKIADITLRESDQAYPPILSFKEKLETAKLLEKLRIDVIETGLVGEDPADAAFIRTLSSTLLHSCICVPVALSKESVDRTWLSLSKAKRPRLNISMPTSTVQMEYMYQMKADKALVLISEITEYCRKLCEDVEFTASDATRSDPEFLKDVLKSAIKAGAKTITLCDSVGEMLPEEMQDFISSVLDSVPELKKQTLSLHCTDNLGLGSAAALMGVKLGVGQIKLSSCGGKSHTLSLEQFLNIIKVRGESLGISCNVNDSALQRTGAELTALSKSRGEL